MIRMRYVLQMHLCLRQCPIEQNNLEPVEHMFGKSQNAYRTYDFCFDPSYPHPPKKYRLNIIPSFLSPRSPCKFPINTNLPTQNNQLCIQNYTRRGGGARSLQNWCRSSLIWVRRKIAKKMWEII